MAYSTLKKLGNQTQLKSRTILVKSIVIGKLNYALALLSNSTKQQLQKLNTLITKSCRIIIGNPCLRWTSNRLLNKCKLKTIWHMITEQGLIYKHTIQQTKTPTTIYEMYTIPNRPKHTNTDLRPKYTPKTKIKKTHYFINFQTSTHKSLKTSNLLT